MDVSIVVSLLPLFFLLHELEEIIMVRSWLDKNQAALRERFSNLGYIMAHPINSGERKKILSLHHGKFNVRVFGKLHAAIQYIISFYNSKSRK